MTSRSTQTFVQFKNTFKLPGVDEDLPAGHYRVDHDEETLESMSILAWYRVGSFIHIPAIGVDNGLHQMVPVNPADIEKALQRDSSRMRAIE